MGRKETRGGLRANPGAQWRAGPWRSNAHFFLPWTYGAIEMQFQSLKDKRGFVDESARREFVRRFNAVPGIQIPDESIDRRPSSPLEALTNSEALAGFKHVIEWALGQVRAHADIPSTPATAPWGHDNRTGS